MHLLLSALVFASLAIGQGAAHFLLKLPRGLGYDIKSAEIPPCGGFAFEGMLIGTNFTIDGYPFSAISTHADVTYTATLKFMNKPDMNETDLMPPLAVSMYGSFCIPELKAREEWLGEMAELRVTQYHASGITYQCALVHFTPGFLNGSNMVDCKNTTGVHGEFMPWGSLPTTTPTASAATPTGTDADSESIGNVARGASGLWAAVAAMVAVLLLSPVQD